MFAKLKRRFLLELPLFRLSYWQFVAFSLWAAWPWLVSLYFPQNDWLMLAPVVMFLPVCYPTAVVLAMALPQCSFAYPLGFSIGIFFTAYLSLVSWRQRRRA